MYLEEEWCTEDQLIKGIRGETVPTRAMALGRAFHAILEAPTRHAVPGGFRAGDFSFDDRTMAPVWNLYPKHAVAEVKATMDLDGCTLVAQADALAGSTCWEFKTTDAYSCDCERYMRSLQWRVLCLVFQPADVRYAIISVDDHENGVVELRWVESFTVYPYPALKDDVRALLESFKSYVTSKGLDEFLRERQRTAAP
jgi:hypothetical protein